MVPLTNSDAPRYVFSDAPGYSFDPLTRVDAVPNFLAWSAIRSAMLLGESEIGALAARLYRYHRIPASPKWRSRLATRHAIDAFIGRDSCGLRLHEYHGWYWWSAPAVARAASPPTYKLYVSPNPDALRAAIAVTADAVMNCAQGIKIGSDVFGLLRPDAFIVYFATFDALIDAAHLLTARLAGIPVHGTPFGGRVAGDGLLSWGRDVPSENGESAQSWRQWVTLRVAEAIVATQRDEAVSGDACGPISRRLARSGIDACTWWPSDVREPPAVEPPPR